MPVSRRCITSALCATAFRLIHVTHVMGCISLYVLAGAACMALQLFEPSEQCFRKAIGVNESSPQAWLGLLDLCRCPGQARADVLLEVLCKLHALLDRSRQTWIDVTLALIEIYTRSGDFGHARRLWLVLLPRLAAPDSLAHWFVWLGSPESAHCSHSPALVAGTRVWKHAKSATRI